MEDYVDEAFESWWEWMVRHNNQSDFSREELAELAWRAHGQYIGWAEFGTNKPEWLPEGYTG